VSRSELGPDLLFVVLDMELENQMDRIRKRHHGDDTATEIMKVSSVLFMTSQRKLDKPTQRPIAFIVHYICVAYINAIVL
jgi:hypothetical protein